jgi:hypothetical protein
MIPTFRENEKGKKLKRNNYNGTAMYKITDRTRRAS